MFWFWWLISIWIMLFNGTIRRVTTIGSYRGHRRNHQKYEFSSSQIKKCIINGVKDFAEYIDKIINSYCIFTYARIRRIQVFAEPYFHVWGHFVLMWEGQGKPVFPHILCSKYCFPLHRGEYNQGWASDIQDSPKTPSTPKVHKVLGYFSKDKVYKLEFYKLVDSKNQSYSKFCWHNQLLLT